MTLKDRIVALTSCIRLLLPQCGVSDHAAALQSPLAAVAGPPAAPQLPGQCNKAEQLQPAADDFCNSEPYVHETEQSMQYVHLVSIQQLAGSSPCKTTVQRMFWLVCFGKRVHHLAHSSEGGGERVTLFSLGASLQQSLLQRAFGSFDPGGSLISLLLLHLQVTPWVMALHLGPQNFCNIDNSCSWNGIAEC